MAAERSDISGDWMGGSRDIRGSGADPWMALAGAMVRGAFDRATYGDGYARRWLVEVGEAYIEWIANGDDDWIAAYRGAVMRADWYPIRDDEGVITERDLKRWGAAS